MWLPPVREPIRVRTGCAPLTLVVNDFCRADVLPTLCVLNSGSAGQI